MPFKLNFLSIVNLYGCVNVHVCVCKFLYLSALYFPIRLALLLSFCADLLPNYFSFLFFFSFSFTPSRAVAAAVYLPAIRLALNCVSVDARSDALRWRCLTISELSLF